MMTPVDMEIKFILVRPRNPINIGSAARVLANFGFSELATVAPYDPTWQEAVSAVGAEDLLKKAKAFKTIEEAVSDCQMVLATTSARRRALKQPLIVSTDLPKYLAESDKSVNKVAVLFGSEKTGLSTKILERASCILVIPTEPTCPSMNLAQSVAICAYELAKVIREKPAAGREVDEEIGFRQKQILIGQCVEMFKHVGYLEHLPSNQKTKLLWNLFNQWGLRKRHAALIHGLIRSIVTKGFAPQRLKRIS